MNRTYIWQRMSLTLAAGLVLAACQSAPGPAYLDCNGKAGAANPAACEGEIYDEVRDIRQDIKKIRRIRKN